MQKFTDCTIPDYGNRNEDGYVRVLTKPRRLGGKLVMKHRVEWEKVHGPIPKGYEINHLCKNRECCNVDHLECITISEHRSKDNALRYKQREKCVSLFRDHHSNLTQSDVAKLFGISQPAVSKIYHRAP